MYLLELTTVHIEPEMNSKGFPQELILTIRAIYHTFICAQIYLDTDCRLRLDVEQIYGCRTNSSENENGNEGG